MSEKLDRAAARACAVFGADFLSKALAELDAQDAEIATKNALIAELTAAIRNEAHDIDCATDFGQRSYIACNCWKSRLLAKVRVATVKQSLTAGE